MAKWQMKLLKITLKSPLRCGDSPLGFVARTLPFVPGHIPLMAMVPSALNLLKYPAKDKQYKLIRLFLENHIRFTPFYIYDENKKKSLFPYDNSQELQSIESHYLTARQKVSLDYNERSARESMLFETETINTVSSNGSKTVLLGYMFWQESNHNTLKISSSGKLMDIDFKDIIQNSQWGGDRNIGYGCLATVEILSVDKIWGESIQLEGEIPEIQWTEEKPVPFWLEYNPNNAITGKIKPLSGRLHDADKGQNGAGQAVWKPKIVWDIGWKANKKITFKIGIRTVSM